MKIYYMQIRCAEVDWAGQGGHFTEDWQSRIGDDHELEGDLEIPDCVRLLDTEGGDRRSGLLGDMFADFGRFLFMRPRLADTSDE